MKTQLNISSIIIERLKLQSTQKALERDFLLSDATLTKISSPLIKETVKGWDEKKRNKFIALVGGKAYTKQTKEFLGII